MKFTRHLRTSCAHLFTLLLILFTPLAIPRETLARQQQRGARPRDHRTRAGEPPTAGASTLVRPRLVLLIVVDQFRYDYLPRYSDLFVEGGLRRLMREGALWSNANYDHMPTYTAPGHATLMTGTWPAENGIIANEWFDRESGRKITSVTDDTTLLIGGAPGEKGASPRRLLASTLGDELRLATGDRAKVIGLSIKNRSAILPAGRHATAAYWFSNGRMVSSNYYFNQLPAWVERFNETRPADRYFGARWERLLPEPEYVRRVGTDAPAWEDIDTAKDTNTFPHLITGGASAPGKAFYNALDYSPFTNDLLLDFAKEAITHEGLGADADTDVLSLSFSANDYVGHRFGPLSHEAMDVTLRVDRQIADLLNFVESRVGLANTFVVLTADHGVALIPEHANALNLMGKRMARDEVFGAITAAIKANFGGGKNAGRETADYVQKFASGGRDVSGFANNSIYFNPVALKRDGVDQRELERVVGEAALTVPGVARYFTRTQLEMGAVSPADPLARRVLHGFHPKRSGDVVLINEPYSVIFDPPDPPTDPRTTTTHGSPYSYDTHVPLIIMGRGVQAGTYLEAATPADIAPTLAQLLRVQAPTSVTGRVLIEAVGKGKK